VPDVTGMGARDAVYLLESRGIKTYLSGRGKVVKQSLAAGTQVKKYQKCHITLE
jgi:cell division protein FtsI (penicillin-binding protein 3)